MMAAETLGRDDRGGVQVIGKAAAVLEALAAARDGLGFTELATRVGLPKSTVHRICRALEQVGYVSVDAAGRRQLGPGVLRLAAVARRDLRSTVAPYLAPLSEELNETVDLAVLHGDRVVFIAQHIAPRRSLMAMATVGGQFPAHTTASGKSLLAELDADEVRRRLPEMLRPEIPGGRLMSREELLGELAEIRAAGLAYEREQHLPGISAVAVAITDPSGSSLSIAVPMPTERFRQDEGRVTAALLRTREEIQAKLGAG